MSRRVAVALTILTVLFFARVAAQAVVALAGPSWLPPMDAWYSGLLPYPVLLPVQAVILGVQVAISRQVWRGAGFFSRPRARLGGALGAFSYVYALAMLGRWVLTGTHVIPIAFHWVLAAYLFTLGRFLARRARCVAQRCPNTSRSRSVTRAAGLVRMRFSSSPTT
jgi:hypothetical protein